ncbi:hypothetical protein ACFXD5_19255 [Streptomyces sp. NPDC059385]|uniref:hypothetical protein n=1 Tax=Streptomyces sp. NPDC059385 TaxID=3346817 RepID=UPI0036B37BCF
MERLVATPTPAPEEVAGLTLYQALDLQAVCEAVADGAEWQNRPPIGEALARAELLAAARHARRALRTSAI